jgi:hypothetical protein
MESMSYAFVRNIIGVGLIVIGWYISILNVGLSRFQPNSLFSKWTFFGLCLILAGAYLPRLWSEVIKLGKK